MAVILSQVLAQIRQVKAAGDATEQVLLGNDGLKIEGVEQMILPDCLTPHHLDHPAKTCNMDILHQGVFQHHRPTAAVQKIFTKQTLYKMSVA